MNLHIVPDSKFSNAFYQNVQEIGALHNNQFVVRTNQSSLKYIKHNLPFARLYSSAFEKIIGNTNTFAKVFIHQFHPLMYRWVATHQFHELNWMVWGTDLYNLPFVRHDFHEPETSKYFRYKFDQNFLYLLKLYVTNMAFKNRAYAKVNNVLTWMHGEFDFAKKQLPALKANHQFFFYENEVPYHLLDKTRVSLKGKKQLTFIVGNSGTPTNNHIDAVKAIDESGVEADLFIPLSYGDAAYASFLKKKLSFYKGGAIHFMETFMPFDEYLNFLANADALVMNHIRPQGYGNILMMMYLGKPVFMNPKNISLPDLNALGFQWHDVKNIAQLKAEQETNNREAIKRNFSHERLLEVYRKLF